MCLIIAPGADGKPALLPRDVFDYAYNSNQDGFGAMWTENGVVNHFKTLGLTADETYAYMQEYVEKHPDVIFHLRLKTHGKITPMLCHPFRVLHRSRHGKDLFFMHNGVLSDFGRVLKPGQSDTTAFKDKLLIPLLTRNPDALADESIMSVLTKTTSGSRLIFLDSEGKVTRTGYKNDWNDRYGLSLSNEYMLPSKVTYSPPPKKVVDIGDGKEVKGGGLFTHFRRVEWSEKISSPVWCKKVGNNLIRTEAGALFHDKPLGTVLSFNKDFIKKSEEFRFLSLAEHMEGDYSDLNDDVPDLTGNGSSFLEDDDGDNTYVMPEYKEEKNNVVSLDKARASTPDLDAKLRYARVFHNAQSKQIESREQLLADILAMGEAELYGLIKEDPETSHVIMAELYDIILEMNAVIALDPELKDCCFDSDHLLKIGSSEYHREAMMDISRVKTERYRRELAAKVAVEAAKREEDTLNISMVNEG